MTVLSIEFPCGRGSSTDAMIDRGKSGVRGSVWTAIVPLKEPGDRKTRLAGRLSEERRDALTMRMAQRVVAGLRDAGIVDIRILSPGPTTIAHVAWVPDQEGGLNASLDHFRRAFGLGSLLVIHPDLPLVSSGDIGQLLAAAETTGGAIAPDRHGTGTNALAIADGRPCAFQFGEDSFARHCAASDRPWAIVKARGLMIDVDTPADLDFVGLNFAALGGSAAFRSAALPG